MKNRIVGLKGSWGLKGDLFSQEQINEIARLATQLNLAYPLAYILYIRGYKTKEDACRFLFPDESNSLHSPLIMKNLDLGAIRIKRAIENNEKILICGDYDVDGITGTSLLLLGLRELGAKVNFFLPHRINDGYGLRPEIVVKAWQHGYSLIITVDNGTCAFEALTKSKAIGIDIIVTDHHQPKDANFDGLYLINPHQVDCFYPCKYLSGVGVVFKLISYLYGMFNKEISIRMYELFMIGTIADLVPLLDENRYLIKLAASYIDFHGGSSALEILKENALFNESHQLSSSDVAFMIAPQINALGRLDDPRNGVLFFTSDNILHQKKIGNQFKTLNEKRKIKEREASERLLQYMEINQINPKDTGCVIEADKDFHAGIIGLIAAKLNQHYNVPTCILTENIEQEILKGSCRTIPACNIFNVLSGIDPDIIINFGGHKAAAGVTVASKYFREFKKQFSAQVLSQCKPTDFQQEITIDSIIELDDFNINFYNQLSLLEPFGMHNPAPIFCIMNVIVKTIKILKENHVKLILENYSAQSVAIIFFNRTDIIQKIKKNDLVCCIGKIQRNCWQEKVSIEMLGVDISLVTEL